MSTGRGEVITKSAFPASCFFFSISNWFTHFYIQQDSIKKPTKKNIQKQPATQRQDLCHI